MEKHPQSGFLLLGLAYLGFISIGLPDGLLGVAWPSIRASFALSHSALGPLLVTFTAGYVLSSFSSGRLLARMNLGVLLALSCLATAISLLTYALTPFWSTMVVFGLLAGLGADAIDAGINTYAATRHNARTVNWLHASYGVGAASGPVIMTSVLGAELAWQWGYGLVGIGQLILAACFALTSSRWPAAYASSPASTSPADAAPALTTLRLPMTGLCLAAFFVYTGLEAAAGVWAYSLFTEARGVTMYTAGMWVSIYWGSLTAGRLIFGLATEYAPVHRLLSLCTVSIVAGAMFIWLNLAHTLSFLGLALMGFASGPIFPSLIATTPQRLGNEHAANAVGFEIAAASLGQSLLPGIVGMLAHNLGLEIVGPVLFSTATLLLVLYALLATVSGEKKVGRAQRAISPEAAASPDRA